MGYIHYGNHAVYDIQYHIVWTTKYCYEILQGKIAVRLKDLIRQGFEARNIQIVRGSIRKECTPFALLFTPIGHRANYCSIWNDTLQNVAAKIFRLTPLGTRILLQDGGSRDGGHDQGLHQESGQWPGWWNIQNCEGLSSVESLSLLSRRFFNSRNSDFKSQQRTLYLVQGAIQITEPLLIIIVCS